MHSYPKKTPPSRIEGSQILSKLRGSKLVRALIISGVFSGGMAGCATAQSTVQKKPAIAAPELSPEKDPKDILKEARSYADEPDSGQEVITRAADAEPRTALIQAHQYIDQPYAEEVITKAARVEPKTAAKYAGRFKNKPWAGELLREILGTDHKLILEFAHTFIDQPYARFLVTKATEIDAKDTLRYARSYADQPWAEALITKAAEEEPWAAVKYGNEFKDQTWARTVIDEAEEILLTPEETVDTEAAEIIIN